MKPQFLAFFCVVLSCAYSFAADLPDPYAPIKPNSGVGGSSLPTPISVSPLELNRKINGLPAPSVAREAAANALAAVQNLETQINRNQAENQRFETDSAIYRASKRMNSANWMKKFANSKEKKKAFWTNTAGASFARVVTLPAPNSGPESHFPMKDKT